MSKLIPGNHKHLTLEDRIYIEQSLDEKKSFRAISKYLCKDPSTISDEVFRNRIPNAWNKGSFNNPPNFCIHRFRCRKTNVPFQPNMITMPKLPTGCIQNGFLLPVILTDRGVEFGNPYVLERTPDGTAKTSIYYCDPMRSSQKGSVWQYTLP